MAANIDQNKLKAAWQLFDKNGTGCITADEVGLVLYSVGLTPTEREAQEYGTSLADGNGNVSYDSFQRIFQYCKPDDEATARKLLTDALKVMDKDEQGTPSQNDIRSVLTSIGENLSHDDMEFLFQLVKIDEKGRIRSEEFVNMLMTAWKD